MISTSTLLCVSAIQRPESSHFSCKRASLIVPRHLLKVGNDGVKMAAVRCDFVSLVQVSFLLLSTLPVRIMKTKAALYFLDQQ